MKYFPLFLFALAIGGISVKAQEHRAKPLVQELDTNEFKALRPAKNGLHRVYFLTRINLYDASANKKARVSYSDKYLICIEGPIRDGQREGVFTTYVLDSLDHSKRYKVYEQDYVNDTLEGNWFTYSISGELAMATKTKAGKEVGPRNLYWIDGKTLLEQLIIQENGMALQREFTSGRLERELTMKQGEIHGPCRRYYPNGKLMEEVIVHKGEFDGLRSYFFDNGQLWNKVEYKMGKPWNALANYGKDGSKKDPGSLRNGNGTLKLYDEDGSLRETITFINGESRERP